MRFQTCCLVARLKSLAVQLKLCTVAQILHYALLMISVNIFSYLFLKFVVIANFIHLGFSKSCATDPETYSNQLSAMFL